MWQYKHPTEIVFGNDEIKNIHTYLKGLEFQNALLITANSAVKSGVAAELKEASEGRIAELVHGIDANPTTENVETCVKMAEKFKIDGIVALGGGSVIDCAKATAIVFAQQTSIQELIEGEPITKALPIIAIPTVSGASSEVSATAVINWEEREIKHALISPLIYPKLAIVDPTLTLSCPPNVTAVSGIDIIAHSLDALTSVKASPITNLYASEAAKIAFTYLRQAVTDPSNTYAKEQLSYAAILAGKAFSQTGTTASHACSYYLTMKYDVPHAEACAFTLDAWFLLNVKTKPDILLDIRRIGFDSAECLVTELNSLKKDLGFRSTLHDIGVSSNDIDEIATQALSAANIKNNITPVNYDMVRDIFLSKQ